MNRRTAYLWSSFTHSSLSVVALLRSVNAGAYTSTKQYLLLTFSSNHSSFQVTQETVDRQFHTHFTLVPQPTVQVAKQEKYPGIS